MLNIERNNKIIQLINERQSVSVNELIEIIGVSGVTIRKILNDLDKKGLIRRTRGGAISLHVPIIEATEKEKERKNIKEKKEIASVAYDIISDHDTIFLDAGSTTLEIVRCIKNGNKRNITVVTNAINIANELMICPDIEVIVAGGLLRHNIMSCVGGFTENILENLNFDKVFIGANSVSSFAGVTTPNLLEAQVKRTTLKHSKKNILVCDSSKFGLTSMCKICMLDELDMVITDDALDTNEKNKLIASGVNLVCANSHFKTEK